jgi:intraflagellar transport protein 52
MVKDELNNDIVVGRPRNRRENRSNDILDMNMDSRERSKLRDGEGRQQQQQQQAPAKIDNSLNILFNQSKDELFSLTNGYKKFQRELKNWKISTNREDITLERLLQCRIFVSVAPTKKFSSSEITALKSYITNHNGSLLILLSEGGESKLNTNINYLLDEYGINVNNDAIVRTSYYKYFNPKEALVPDGILNRAISELAGKQLDLNNVLNSSEKNELAAQSLQYVYPFGATLNVQKPSIPILSSGTVCYPIKRPLCALYGCNVPVTSRQKGMGRLCVIGSAHVFHDSYIDKEENRKLLEALVRCLTDETCQLNQIDSEDPDVNEYNHIPNISKIAERVKTCLQDSEDIPRDISKLFDDELFALDMKHVPKVIRGYNELKIKHEPLPLISPQFETPLPALKPAVYPPRFYEPEPPMLELFDLDEHFSSENARLAQLTNKCTDDDLEFYIRECGEVLGVSRHLQQSERNAKGIIAYIASRVLEYKCLNMNG